MKNIQSILAEKRNRKVVVPEFLTLRKWGFLVVQNSRELFQANTFLVKLWVLTRISKKWFLINTLPAKLWRFDKDFEKIIFVKYSLCQTVGFDKDFVKMIFIKYSTFQFQMFQFQQQIFGVVLRMFLTLVSTKAVVKFFSWEGLNNKVFFL